MRILLPVDGSSYSIAAIRYLAKYQLRMGNAMKVELLNVQNSYTKDEDDINIAGVHAYLKSIDENNELEIAKLFDELRPIVHKVGLVAEEKGINGSVGDSIVKEAESTGSDLIVMGTHGRSPLSSLFLGSISSHVISRTKCPILLLREDTVPVKGALRVGLCVDDLEHAMAGAHFIIDHLNFLGRDATITAIHVKTGIIGRSNVLEAITSLLVDAGVSVEPVELKGVAEIEITNYAKQHLDLLVMGSHGYGRFKAAVVGSTTARVGERTHLPILLVKP